MTNSPSDEPRPPRRKARIDVPVDPQTLDEARKKAGGMPNLRAVLRGFLKLWVSGEYPNVPPDVIEQEKRRAKKTKRKKTSD